MTPDGVDTPAIRIWVVVREACSSCGSPTAIAAFAHEPTEADHEEIRKTLTHRCAFTLTAEVEIDGDVEVFESGWKE